MMIELASIMPNRSTHFKIVSERFLISRNIESATQISYNDLMNIQMQVCEIANNIKDKKDTINNSINNLRSLLEIYNDNIIDDILKFNIIPLIIFNLRLDNINCTHFIQFLLLFLKKLEQNNCIHLVNVFVNPETIKFLCDFLKESVNYENSPYLTHKKENFESSTYLTTKNANYENYTYLTQKNAMESLLIILEHHEASSVFFSDPRYELLATLIFVFKKGLSYTNGKSGNFRFNLEQFGQNPIRHHFELSIFIIRCFSLFFTISKNIDHNITNLLIETTRSECFQVNNEAMNALIICSERFPSEFFQNFHNSHNDKALTTLLDPDIMKDDTTLLLALDIIANISNHLNNDDVFLFLLQTPIMSNLTKLLRKNFEKFLLPISLIIINFVHKSKMALTSILNAEPHIIQNILCTYVSDLRTKDKCAILYLYASCIASFDDELCSIYLPFFIEVGVKKSILSDLVQVIDSTQSEEMVLCIIQSIVHLLDYNSNKNTDFNTFMSNTIMQYLSFDLLHEISQISNEHNLWAIKLIEIVKKQQTENNDVNCI